MTSTTIGIPVTTTWDLLRRTRNEAAVDVLAVGLDAKSADIRHASLRALACREEPSAATTIILRWNSFDERDLDFLRVHRRGLREACVHLLERGSYAEKLAALAATDTLDLHENVEPLLELALNPTCPIRQQAADCLLTLCHRWGQKGRSGKATLTARRAMLEPIYRQLMRYDEHQNPLVATAWLKLTHWDDSAQRGLISDPRTDAYWLLLKHLSNSDDPDVMQLLAGYVGRRTTPKPLLRVIVERRDPELLIELAKLDEASQATILDHLCQLPPLACIENLHSIIEQVPLQLQDRVWLLVAASTENNALVLRAATEFVASGDGGKLRVACAMLRHCRNTDLQSLVPAVQHEHANTASSDNLGSLLREAAGWVVHGPPELQAAARQFFDQFTVANLLAQVRVWPAQMCTAMADIVRIVEPDCGRALTKYLQSPAPRQRLDALRVAKLLQVTDQVSDILFEMLWDSRLMVRVSVIDLLGGIRYQPLQSQLPRLLDDPSTDIQDAAKRALRRLSRSRQRELKQQIRGEPDVGQEATSSRFASAGTSER